MSRPQVNFKCSVNDCDKQAHAKGWCRIHWTRMHHYGRLEKVKGLVKGKCTASEGCNNPIKSKGFCVKHYSRFLVYGRTEKIQKPSKRKHALYILWHQRKQDKNLCDAWLDFWTFVKDIGEKPEGNYNLIRVDRNKLYGPDNFKWSEILIRSISETDKEWWARKWETRRIRNPDEEYDRNLQRNFGITIEKYNEMFWIQNGICAICGEKEKVLKNGRIKRLAVDHCHNSDKIRELLCHRCNKVLGAVAENLGILDKMKTYLIKHKELASG